MFNPTTIYSSFSVNNIEAAKEFYSSKLGLEVREINDPGCGKMLRLKIDKDAEVLIYPKIDHVPASFTVLNFGVSNIEREVRELKNKGIQFEQYESTDELGINHNAGPLIAWFKDPAGNFLSVIKEESLSEHWTMDKNVFIPGPLHEVFRFWTEPGLLEQWSSPEEMTLEIPLMENRTGGQYRFEHTGKEGLYICEGTFTEYVPDEKLVQNETVRGPDGKILFDNLDCIVEFKEKGEGTYVSIKQLGFKNREERDMCELGWDQSLEKLQKFFVDGFYLEKEFEEKVEENFEENFKENYKEKKDANKDNEKGSFTEFY